MSSSFYLFERKIIVIEILWLLQKSMMESHYWSIIVSIVCIHILVNVQADVLAIQDLSTMKKNSQYFPQRKLCGKSLADTLQWACDGAYNAMYKKSENDQDYLYQSDQEDLSSVEFVPSTFPFRTRKAAASMNPKNFRRFTRGIIAECCHKPCSLGELKTYCAPRN
uniref:Insulin-like peptide 3 n=1 Tax=Chrysopa pallens TaxID=417485 RepID=A0A482P8V3_CHRPA|nr:insulin-like peptide 3 [Chrysopa pallens]